MFSISILSTNQKHSVNWQAYYQPLKDKIKLTSLKILRQLVKFFLALKSAPPSYYYFNIFLI